MLSISMIGTIQFIPVTSKLSDFDMTLIHLFQRYPQYLNAYLKRERKTPLMLDNSFFELGKAASVETMSGFVSQNLHLGISTLILPDGDFSGLDKFEGGLLHNCIPMLIPTTSEELFIAFNIALNSNETIKVGISCIHALKSQNISVFDSNTRIAFVENVLGRFAKADADKLRRANCLHFLGLNNNPWEEMEKLAFFYEATLDSSAFVWPLLRRGKSIKDIKEKYVEAVDFTYEASFYTQGVVKDKLFELRAEMEENKMVRSKV